eukprot:TRINITY_DN110_c0_g1_i1.p1 TRINITY_DN110_c0_g1~~TRINITY_DN110_c0_g1_i1.p1  ORF type:complete len:2139 (+),score=504.33 TRINITY_DN110_c0_g1_i1:433-6849(+)
MSHDRDAFMRFKHYDFSANQNLVLSLAHRQVDTEGGAGIPETLSGRELPRMGDRVLVDKPSKAEVDEVEKRKRPKKTERGLPTIFAAEDTSVISYRPQTKDTQIVFENFLFHVQPLLGDQPRDVLLSTAEDILMILKDDSNTDARKRALISEEIGGNVPVEVFSDLLRLSRGLTDFGEEKDEEDEGGFGEKDEEEGVALVLESDEEEEEDRLLDDVSSDESDMSDEERDMKEEKGSDDEEDVVRGLHRIEGKEQDMQQEAKSQHARWNVNPQDIDAYWLERVLNESGFDPDSVARLSQEVLSTLSFPDEHEMESRLVALLQFSNFELVKKLVLNRFKIQYCIRLAKAVSEEEKELIRAEMPEDVRMEIEGRETVDLTHIHRDGEEMKVESQKSAVPQRSALDLDSLSFSDGGHFMSNKKVRIPGSYRQLKKGYEEVYVPARKPHEFSDGERLVPIQELPPWSHDAFKITHLNRIQSRVCHTALESSENILVCAPTGAGKTIIAMMCILRELGRLRKGNGTFDLSKMKIVYVAPMKALVQEMCISFQKAFDPYGLVVSELTGDNQLSKKEVAESHIIVTTPEKWDIVTRKSGEGSFAQMIRLLIIDEVHLLHDDRGPVLESIVSRTIRKIEETQELIRIVALSATLPNYRDVAAFLRVQPQTGLFHFDAGYRPCPLEQQFIGVTDKKPAKRMKLMNEITYEKVLERAGKYQILVFVHSRKETFKTAQYICEKALEEDTIGNFLREDSTSRKVLAEMSQEMKNIDCQGLLPYGFAIHHAGMCREDRAMVESLFENGQIRVLCSTATLAWGVNLPAHTVIIKGTQIYNPEKGKWMELSPQDILQMMGRAGRPKFDTEGEGIIITSHSELQYHLSLLNQQLPIESQLISRLPDALNAEIVLGSVNNIEQAVEWLGYTYLFVRMLRSPEVYGLTTHIIERDAQLRQRRTDLAHTTALILDKANLINYDKRTGNLQPTELGRISSYYYVTHQSMATYHRHLKPYTSMIDLFRVFSMSSEFKFIGVREEEKIELEKFINRVPIPIKEGVEEPTAKVNILLQSYISQLRLEGFALMSDMVYVSQSAGRIARALHEIALSRRWAGLEEKTLDLCKMIEHRMWMTQCPLRQFRGIQNSLFRVLERREFPWERIYDLSSQDIGEMVRKPDLGKKIHRYVHRIPRIEVSASVQPVLRSLLKVDLTLTPAFEWNLKYHNYVQLFHILVLDCDCENILYHEPFLFTQDHGDDESFVSFVVPMLEPLPPQYFIRVVSDRWIGSSSEIPISFRHLFLPRKNYPCTELLDLRPIPLRSALKGYPTIVNEIFGPDGIKTLNGIQTQVFGKIFHSKDNVFVGCPPGSGKTLLAELSLVKLIIDEENSENHLRCVYVTPKEPVADEIFGKWSDRFGKLGLSVVRLTGEGPLDVGLVEQSNVIVCTPREWDVVSRNWQRKAVFQEGIQLFIMDDLHMVGYEGGHTMEVVMSRMRSISPEEAPIRFVSLAHSVAHFTDMAGWAGAVEDGVFNFHPSARPIPLEIQVRGFDNHTFSTRIEAMRRPAFNAVRDHGMGVPVLVFVPSGAVAKQVAVDFVTYAHAEDDPKRFVSDEDGTVANVSNATIRSNALKRSLEFGIGFIDDTLDDDEFKAVQSLFISGHISVLVAKYDTVWALSRDVIASLVVIMGTQVYDGQEHRYVDIPVVDVVQMMGRALYKQSLGCVCSLFCHSPRKEFFKKFLFEPLPVESHLDQFLADHLCSEVASRVIENKEHAVDYLTWSYLYRRIQPNPNYYHLHGVTHEHVSEFLSEIVEDSLETLEQSHCVSIVDEMEVEPLNLGMICSYYDIAYTTIDVYGSSLHEKAGHRHLLEIVSNASEFDDLPLRLGDEEQIALFARHLPHRVRANSRWNDPHTKAYILIQCHFNRASLSRLLQKDCARVIQKGWTLLNAIVDVAASNGWLGPALRAMELCQMSVQGLWESSSPLLQLPHFDDDLVKRCHESSVETLFDVMDLEDDVRLSLLQLNESEMEEVASVCNSFPVVEMSLSDLQGTCEAGEALSLLVKLERGLDEDEEVDGVPVVHAPRFPKTKTEDWWVVIGAQSNNLLLAIKKVTLVRQRKVKLQFLAPQEPGEYDLSLLLMSGCYLGCDQEYHLHLTVSSPEDQ